MSKITDISGAPINLVPSIKGVKPVGTQILVELLTPNEIMNTPLHLAGDSKTISGAPQGYILEIGPMVDPKWGFTVGNRIVMSGSFTPLPEASSTNGRARACVEPHTIKAVLVE